MEKQPQLYIKNEKGRYERWFPPQIEDNKLYRKVNGKYVPTSMLTKQDLGEGVWVVYKSYVGKHITKADFLRYQYKLDHVADLQNPYMKLNLSELGKLDKIIENEFWDDKSCRGLSVVDAFKHRVKNIVARLIEK